MVQTILVPTDFSNNALVATKYAVGLAKELGSEIHVIHAYQPFTSAFQSPLANETDEKRAKLGAEKTMSVFLESVGKAMGVQITHSIVKQSVVSAIKEYIRDNAGTLLVMGTHGASGTRKDVLGSNTYDVTKTLSAPMLIVPEHTTNNSIRNVVFFTDYQQNDTQTLTELGKVTGKTDVKCTLVHILKQHDTPTQDDFQKLENWKTNLGQQASFENISTELVQGKENVETVNKVLQKLNADLVLLTLVGGRGFFEKLLHKSLARTIILNSETPVFLSSREVE
ncbi:universal stress protein [Sphingobacterium sp. UME9]|uniref:universal stress protein n=1 Tax=Sphingobacterium sp. UME9 TaxID=1862316 RepID=UPI00160005FF|nr:universal stress protein [Sphingobacterium sp. UME9]MBB1644552.1 hypothetical protein [Sphingobacterium sp. UME9]